ncbi:hypothetical protein ASC80_01610 [Afipia sp. Root123D2]|uniref:hypothetical protein n=1 Tax=Afipia sp. Root123D2 TaxID=1736436 RepID=UPI0006FAEE69|nr:hypothetical protein [Afipia sp. Root123D2]KQW22119.1 hypothetical protein ASC80_01610 [Afipia sp. Root123D2]
MTRKPKSEVNEALRAAQLEWLAHAEKTTGKTHTELAREASVDPSTLSKFKSQPNRVLTALTITQISTRWSIPAGEDVIGPGAPRGFGEEAVPYKTPINGSMLDAAIQALIAGRNNCDPWTLRTRSLEAVGFMPGDVVLVDLSASPRDGDAVLAQVYDFTSMKARTIWRRFRQSGELGFLVPASFDPDAGEPMLVNGRNVVVKGVLLPHRLRPVNNAA